MVPRGWEASGGPDEHPFWTQTQFCLLHACCVTLGTGLLLSGPKPAHLQDGRSLAHFSPQPATSGRSYHGAATFWAEYSLEGGHQEEEGPLPGVPTQLSISRGRGPPSCLGGARHPEVPPPGEKEQTAFWAKGRARAPEGREAAWGGI